LHPSAYRITFLSPAIILINLLTWTW